MSETVIFAEEGHYRCPESEAALHARVFQHGARIGVQFLEPMYAGGVLIPRDHPAYPAALAFIAALADAEKGQA